MKSIHSMTLEEKVGQLFMCGFNGHTPTEGIIDLIENYHIGGVCYFSRNLDTPKQVNRLSATLQEHANNELPLFLSADQEGGMILRLSEGVTISPGNMAIGAVNDEQATFEMAKTVGQELTAMGINMNFAPSVDVNNNPENPVIGVRSYSEDPETVGKMGSKAIQGYQYAGVSASAKHFPGHGDTSTDSHLSLPIVNHSIDRLRKIELPPFAEVIKNGVDSIMISHISFTALEEQLPATLSKKVVTGILRNELNYDGVVVSDCMEMRAILNDYGNAEAAIMAVEAGVDLVLVSHTYERQRESVKAVLSAVISGRLSEKRINKSVERILALKEKRNIGYTPTFNHDNLLRKESIQLANHIQEKSITLVKNDKKLVPLVSGKRTITIWPEIGVTSEVDEQFTQNTTLGDKLKEFFPNIEEYTLPMDENELIEMCGQADQIVIATYNASLDKKQKNAVKRITELYGQKTVICALRNPYDLNDFLDARAFIVSYEAHPQALQATANVLAGKITAKGKLPVSIQGPYVIGYSESGENE